MARALTTSEANQYLLSLGYMNTNVIEDNEFTKESIKTDYRIQEDTNIFDKEHKYRWWKPMGTFFCLNIQEYMNGKSYLTISKNFTDNGYSFYCETVVNYAKLTAKDKKRFIQMLEELVSKKQMYHLEQTNYDGNHYVYGDAMPSEICELK